MFCDVLGELRMHMRFCSYNNRSIVLLADLERIAQLLITNYCEVMMDVGIATIHIDYLFIVLFSQKHENLYPVQRCVLNTISAKVEFGLSIHIA